MPGLGTWILVGMLLIFIGILVIMAATIYEATRQPQQGSVQAGGVVMIGPIPIIFGTSWRMAIIAILLAIVLIVIAFAFMLLARPPAPSSTAPAQALRLLRQLLAVSM